MYCCGLLTFPDSANLKPSNTFLFSMLAAFVVTHRIESHSSCQVPFFQFSFRHYVVGDYYWKQVAARCFR